MQCLAIAVSTCFEGTMRATVSLLSLSLLACNEAAFDLSNQPPEVSILQPVLDAQLPPDGLITVRLQLRDREDDPKDLDLTLSSGGEALVGERVWDTEDELTVTPKAAFGTGRHTLTAFVLDADGASAEDSVTFEVVANLAPTVGFETPKPNVVVAQELPLEVVARIGDDASLGELELSWTGILKGRDLPRQPDPNGVLRVTLTDLPLGKGVITLTAVDGWGAIAQAVLPIQVVVGDTDGDGAVAETLGGTDCDDTNDAIGPGQPEVCNDLDDNCDGDADEHAVAEVCNGIDDDCDGFKDDAAADAPEWFFDGDGDGVGVVDQSLYDCVQPTNYVATSGDCDDDNEDVYDGAPELCDALDNDCDGERDEGTQVCPCPVENYAGHAYQMCWSLPTDWFSARDACYADGYHLVTVDDASENNWLDQTFDAYTTAPFWIGFNDVATEGQWVWETGALSTFTAWHSGEPNNLYNNEDCAELNYWTDGTWNDENCMGSRRFVCEAE